MKQLKTMTKQKSALETKIENEFTGKVKVPATFTPVEDSLPKFINFKERKEFTGKYLSLYEHKGEKNKVEWSGYLFEDVEGFKHLVSISHAIKKAVDKYGGCWYKIVFEGQTKIEGGKYFNNFKISVSSTGL